MSISAMFQPTVTRTGEWIADVMVELGLDDAHAGLQALRAGLHAIRDRLPPREAAGLAAGLPVLLRGFYYEGWCPEAQARGPGCPELYARVQRELGDDGVVPAEAVVRATIRVLARRFAAGELGELEGCLSRRLAELWPAPVS